MPGQMQMDLHLHKALAKGQSPFASAPMQGPGALAYKVTGPYARGMGPLVGPFGRAISQGKGPCAGALGPCS